MKSWPNRYTKVFCDFNSQCFRESTTKSTPISSNKPHVSNFESATRKIDCSRIKFTWKSSPTKQTSSSAEFTQRSLSTNYSDSKIPCSRDPPSPSIFWTISSLKCSRMETFFCTSMGLRVQVNILELLLPMEMLWFLIRRILLRFSLSMGRLSVSKIKSGNL